MQSFYCGLQQAFSQCVDAYVGYSLCVCVCNYIVCALLSLASVQGPVGQQLLIPHFAPRYLSLWLWLPGNPRVSEAEGFILPRKEEKIGGKCMKCG